MKEYLEKLPGEIRDLLHLIDKTARGLEMKAYLVGGFVRDLILGVSNFDLDIVIEGDGIVFAEKLSKKLQTGLIRHRRFGTATLSISHKLKVDIATARKEVYPQAASLPEVTPGSLKDDLFRRDFTINAMAISITGKDFGKLIDLFGGRKDLAEKKIRILHGLSFIDDPTRILRAIRFEQRFEFKIEPETLKLLKEACRLKMLLRVSPQRLRDELILIFKEKEPLRQIRRARELAGLSFVSRHLNLTQRQSALIKSAIKEVNWYHGQYKDRRPLDSWLIYLMGLLDGLNEKEIKLICERYAFNKGEKKRMLSFKALGPLLGRELAKKKIKPERIFALLEPLSYEVLILLKAKYKKPNLQNHLKDFFEIYNGLRLHIKGEDLHRLGFLPGPHYKKIFSQVLGAKLNGKVKTKEEELALITKLTTKGR